VTVITRKAYGGAYDVMASKHVRADVNFAYPTAEIAVMGSDGAVNIVYREAIAKAQDPAAARAAYVAEYKDKFANPYHAASLGYVDEVIRPRETRLKVAGALRMLKNKRQSNPPKKHGNIPL
jgi:propionyl-CoA carboxylase beta chain